MKIVEKNNFKIDYSKALNENFFRQDTKTVAKGLLGKVLVRKIRNNYLTAKIVETEAYLPDGDLSCHAAVGKTQRNAPMFEAGGILYVYFIYGVHHCINIVTELEGKGCAVLIRAAEPLMGLDIMSVNRKNNDVNKLCKGPGNLAKAFGFTVKDNFLSLCSKNLFIQDFQKNNKNDIITTKRVGINKSKELLLRYYLKDSSFVTNIKK
jgi:DNA-3-methyladenine glycosylase